MNISEFEDKIEHPNHKKEFRKLNTLSKDKLFQKLYNDKLLLRNNIYYNYNTLTQVVDNIVKDIYSSIDEIMKNKEPNEEVFFFLDNNGPYNLHLICWKHSNTVELETIYKKAVRYTKLGSLVD